MDVSLRWPSPGFSTEFGRGRNITALQYMSLDPSLGAVSRATYLAATQAGHGKSRAKICQQPGKVLHETRGRRDGCIRRSSRSSVTTHIDATPLFTHVARATYTRYGGGPRRSLRLFGRTSGCALAWIDNYGDVDGGRLVEYAEGRKLGLIHQGWKDSPPMRISTPTARSLKGQSPVRKCKARLTLPRCGGQIGLSSVGEMHRRAIVRSRRTTRPDDSKRPSV